MGKFRSTRDLTLNFFFFLLVYLGLLIWLVKQIARMEGNEDLLFESIFRSVLQLNSTYLSHSLFEFRMNLDRRALYQQYCPVLHLRFIWVAQRRQQGREINFDKLDLVVNIDNLEI